MSALHEYSPFVRIARVIDQRLLYQSTGADRLLSGVKYDFEGKLEARGKRDLPFIQPTGYSDFETIGPGANHPQPQASQGSSPAWDIQSFAFWVFVPRENGLYSRVPGVPVAKLGLMDLVARVRDAVEVTADGLGILDRRLEKTCAKPIQSAVTQNEFTDLSWGALIEFEAQTDTYCAGGRTA